MKIKQRSYPHPVLGNKDDIPKYAFQASFDNLRTDKQFYEFSAHFLCSSRELNELTASGQAAFLIHIECTNTVFRQSFQTGENEIVVRIPAEDLNENVEVNFFICAQTEINGYKPDGSHSDYAGVDFSVKKGDILAVADGVDFRAQKDFDDVGKIPSIMQIIPHQTETAMRVDFSSDPHKILIFLPAEDYELYNQLMKNPMMQNALTCSIVIPALMEAVRIVKTENPDEFEDCRWYSVLRSRLHSEKLWDESDFIVTAQKLLELPLNRALKTAKEAIEQEQD